MAEPFGWLVIGSWGNGDISAGHEIHASPEAAEQDRAVYANTAFEHGMDVAYRVVGLTERPVSETPPPAVPADWSDILRRLAEVEAALSDALARIRELELRHDREDDYTAEMRERHA